MPSLFGVGGGAQEFVHGRQALNQLSNIPLWALLNI